MSVLFITNLYNRPILPLQKNAGSSTATLSHQQQHQQQASGGESKSKTSSHFPRAPAKKEKPLGKGTATIAMKSNSAYDQWSRDEDGIARPGASTPTQNPSGRSYAGGGRRGNENVYRF
jgi:hypothetical protein